jgi:hypothetical protein
MLRDTMPDEAQVALDRALEGGASLFWVTRMVAWLWVVPRAGCACRRLCRACVVAWTAALPAIAGWRHRGYSRFRWRSLDVGKEPKPQTKRKRRSRR